MIAPAECPVCGNYQETVFFNVADELVCRSHEGHPLAGVQERDFRNSRGEGSR